MLLANECASRLGRPVFIVPAQRGTRCAKYSTDQLLAGLRKNLKGSSGDAYAALVELPETSEVIAAVAMTDVGRKQVKRAARLIGLDLMIEVRADRQIALGTETEWQLARQFVDDRDGCQDERADLVHAVENALGWVVTASFVGARSVGWEYEGDPGVPCSRCGGNQALFGADMYSSTRSMYRTMATVCSAERVARCPKKDDEQRAVLRAWREYSRARADADVSDSKRRYAVYVIELHDETAAGRPTEPWVYVGQTTLSPEERFSQHKRGDKHSRVVKKFGTRLRPELFKGHPRLRTEAEALAYEQYLAELLRTRGFVVAGGH